MAFSDVKVPSLRTKVRAITKLFQLRERVRAASKVRSFNSEERVNIWVEALWKSAGRTVSSDLKKELKAWSRCLEDNELPSDLFKGMLKMYLGLTEEILIADPFEQFSQLIRPQDESYRHCTKALEHFERQRPSLQSEMLLYYREQTSNRELPLITAPGWIRPILMTGIDGEPEFDLENPDGDPAGKPVIPIIPHLDVPLSEIRQRLNLDGEMENREAYRPLEIHVTDKGLRAVCAQDFYFGTHDTCEILGVELAAWMQENPGRRPNTDGSDLPLRHRVRDVFNLRNRIAVLGVSTLLIALDSKKGNRYFWHQRSHEVATNPGGRSVVPSGTFQPFTANLATFLADFRIVSTILREFAEELLGEKDFQKMPMRPLALEHCDSLRPFMKSLDEGQAKIFFLGIGIDPVNTVPEIMTAFLFREENLPPGTVARFKTNFEGELGSAPLSPEALRKFAANPNVHSASAGCALLTARRLDELLSELPPPRRRAA